eukprot:748383-Hanusia_phi.AAC.5
MLVGRECLSFKSAAHGHAVPYSPVMSMLGTSALLSHPADRNFSEYLTANRQHEVSWGLIPTNLPDAETHSSADACSCNRLQGEKRDGMQREDEEGVVTGFQGGRTNARTRRREDYSYMTSQQRST